MFSSSWQVSAPVPDWAEVFKDPTLPLMVDIGSGNNFPYFKYISLDILPLEMLLIC